MILSGQYQFAPHHPSLEGHFPGNPIVPGVVILGRIMQELYKQSPDLKVTGVRRMKFLRLLKPEQPFNWQFQQVGANQLTLRAWIDEQIMLDAKLTLTT